jgi:hypothetical protein
MKTSILTCILLAFISTLGCAMKSGNGPFPVIEQDQVVFQNGKKVRYEADKIALQNNIVRPEIDKPVYVIERAFIVHEWERVIVETKYAYYEDSGVVLRFYDFEGKLLNKTPEYFGSFRQLLMKNKNCMILVQRSGHYNLTKGYILGIDGKEVGTIAQRPMAYDAIVSEEGDLFLIEYAPWRKGIPYWSIDVLDVKGKVLATQDFNTGGTYTIQIGERKIRLSLPNPQ